ncbi:MAG: PilZ domain-containing protein [Terracidiphilus sp.]
MNPLNSESPLSSGGQAATHGQQEVRCAVRFPLSLPVVLSAGANEIAGLTRNISASGVLFALGEDLPVGMDVKFSMRMPRAVLGAPQDVLVHCKGRVVRCSSSHNEHLAAATIDEYRFAEH